MFNACASVEEHLPDHSCFSFCRQAEPPLLSSDHAGSQASPNFCVDICATSSHRFNSFFPQKVIAYDLAELFAWKEYPLLALVLELV